MKHAIRASARKFYERGRRADRWRNRAVEIAGQINIFVRSAGYASGNEGRGQTLQHLRAIKREWLGAQESSAGSIEDVHAHVVSIGPNTQVWIIEEVRTQVKSVTVVAAGGIAGRRDRNTLVGRHAGAGELTNDPAIVDLIVHDDWIAIPCSFTHTTETAPQSRNARWSKLRCASRLVEDLVPFIDDLHILRGANFPIRVGRRTVASDSRERNAIKVEPCRRHVHL